MTVETEAAYRAWLADAHRPAHGRRSASSQAAVLLPHLRPGMRLIDIGCGPGSVTNGLTELVGTDGFVIGVDAASDVLEIASAGDGPATFAASDALRLPFPDDTFDAAFASALLQHLRRPLDALREAHRVLRPGGVVGVVDADWGGSLFAPADPRIDRAQEVLAALRGGPATGPTVGRELRGLLHDAGFARTEGSATAMYEGDETAARRTGERWGWYLSQPPLVDHAVALGLASRDELADLASAWRDWGNSPAAFSARFWCAAVGWKVRD